MFDDLTVTFTAHGVRREDGKTAAEIEAEQQETTDGAE